MSSYVLSCSSTADLSVKHFAERDIPFIKFHFYMNDVHYYDDYESVPSDQFYKAMSEGVDTKTSQINVDEFAEYFTKFAEQGKDVLHISLSSGLSGSSNSARIAAEDVSKAFPERKIYVVDSLAASSGFGLLVDMAADKRDAGMDIDSLRDWLEENRLRVSHWFFSTDLQYFVKGGRVSKSSAIIGSFLGICPLLHVDKEGKLVPVAKVRTKKRVIAEIVEKMKQYAENGAAYNGKCYICHSVCRSDAEEVRRLVEEAFPALEDEVKIYNIGTTIGSHTGPGTVALFFLGNDRLQEI